MLIRALGNLTLEGAKFPHPKLLLLLTYLSLEGPQPRRRVAQLFWPEASDARNRLSVSLSRIGRSLHGALDCDREFVATTLQSDAGLVREAVRAGQHSEAVAAYGGRFLGGIALRGFREELAEWVNGTTDDLTRMVQHAHLSLAEELAGEERFTRAALHAERSLDTGGLSLLDPADMARLHTLLVAGGSSRAAVVRAETAHFELDLAQSRAQARSLLRVAAPGSMPAGSAAGTAYVVGEVPAGEPGLIGRHAELAELERYLGYPDRRLISLIGPGGIGKSRLALAAAARADSAASYAARSVVVKLEAVPTPRELLAVLAEALGPSLRHGERPLDVLVERLGSGQRLLVLDNFEHLLGATDQLLELLQRCPGLRLLVTSREPLGVSEEWQVLVEGLPFPPEAGWLASGDGGESVVTEAEAWPAFQLFELRARRVSHRFALNLVNLQHVAAICRACAGSPLAIELAASWVGVLTPAEIAAELARNIDLLDARNRDAGDRHRSIRGVFLSSWRLLGEAERSLFCRLAVFHGGFELSSAQQVAAADFVPLENLLRRAFLVRDAGGRYYRHPLLRQLAVEKLAEDPEGQREMLERHARHMRDLAVQAHAHLMDPVSSAWRARLEVEGPNLSAALAWASDNRDAKLALDMVEALNEFWIWRGQLDEALRWTGAVARFGAREADPRRYLKVITRGIFLLAVSGDHASALTWHKEAMTLVRELGSVADEARLWSHRGVVATYQCDYAAAERFYESALTLATEANDADVIGRVLNNLGDVSLFQGRPGRARAYFARSLELERALGDRQMESNVLGSLAVTELRLGNLAAAELLLRESAALVLGLGVVFSLPTTLEQYSELASSSGRWVEGVRLMASAATLRQSLRTPVEPFARAAQLEWRLAAERALGPEALAAELAAGGAWPAEQAVAWAMNAAFHTEQRGPGASGDRLVS